MRTAQPPTLSATSSSCCSADSPDASAPPCQRTRTLLAPTENKTTPLFSVKGVVLCSVSVHMYETYMWQKRGETSPQHRAAHVAHLPVAKRARRGDVHGCEQRRALLLRERQQRARARGSFARIPLLLPVLLPLLTLALARPPRPREPPPGLPPTHLGAPPRLVPDRGAPEIDDVVRPKTLLERLQLAPVPPRHFVLPGTQLEVERHIAQPLRAPLRKKARRAPRAPLPNVRHHCAARVPPPRRGALRRAGGGSPAAAAAAARAGWLGGGQRPSLLRHLLRRVLWPPRARAEALGGRRQHVGHGHRAQKPASPPRTKWTRRVPHPVLIGHAASLSQGPAPRPLNAQGAVARAAARGGRKRNALRAADAQRELLHARLCGHARTRQIPSRGGPVVADPQRGGNGLEYEGVRVRAQRRRLGVPAHGSSGVWAVSTRAAVLNTRATGSGGWQRSLPSPPSGVGCLSEGRARARACERDAACPISTE